ncbi:TolC family protein [Colwelliaceae bacterium BS250]
MSPLSNYNSTKGVAFVAIMACNFIAIDTCLAAVPVQLSEPNNLASTNELPLSLSSAIKQAQQNDPWLNGNLHKQQAIESLSTVANTLPDPKISIGIANLGADNFEFDQEPMSQFKVGVTQMFPRGDSLAIKQKQLKQQSEQYPLLREDRKIKVAATVGSLWLDAYKTQQSVALIEQSRQLFIELIDVAAANYASARKNVKQQDVVIAEIELTRLEDKIALLQQQQTRIGGQLSQWLTSYNSSSSDPARSNLNNDLSVYQPNYLKNGVLNVDKQFPDLQLLQTDIINHQRSLTPPQLAQYFSQHPSVLALDKKLTATATGVNLAEQKYQPEWGVTASYAYRDDDPMGNNRADLLSLGITFDLPLFTENRQDNEVRAAISETEVVKTERILLLRKMMASFSSSKGRLHQLKRREILFSDKLLPQINEQIESTLSSYTNNDGSYAQVLRARISLLMAQVDLLSIQVEQQKLVLELNYLFSRGNSNFAERMTIASKSLNKVSQESRNAEQ